MNFLELESRSFGGAWLLLLNNLIKKGEKVSPRGSPIYEIRNTSLLIQNAQRNVLHCDQRKVSYRFMVAEWLWIWFGREDVASIANFNPKIANFSDNGVTFNGAYGPPIRQQWRRVAELLQTDPDTRQAVLQIYRAPQGPTKDVPCTLALQFFIREGRLHTTAYMRSSDVWLGLPYDTFTFSMLGSIMATTVGVKVGSLTLHLGSSHLYDSNLEAAQRVLSGGSVLTLLSPQVAEPPAWLNGVLNDPRTVSTPTGAIEPWQHYAHALSAPTNDSAFSYLEEISNATAV